MRTCLLPKAAMRFALWPFVQTAAARLNQLQTHIIMCLLPRSRGADESLAQYFQNRHTQAGRIAARLLRRVPYMITERSFRVSENRFTVCNTLL